MSIARHQKILERHGQDDRERTKTAIAAMKKSSPNVTARRRETYVMRLGLSGNIPLPTALAIKRS